MISSKLEKLINLASSDNPNEAEKASKMAVSLMIREGVAFNELLKDPSKFYLESLVTLARSYSVRTTQTGSESQKLFAQILGKVNQAYNKPEEEKVSASSNSPDKSEYLRTQEQRLKEREEALKRKEQDLEHREHRFKFEKKRAEPQQEKKQARSRKENRAGRNTSHNVRYIKNNFLHMLVTRPFRMMHLFLRSLIYGIFHSLLINIAIFSGIIFFGLDFTYYPGIISFFFIVAFPFMVWKSYRLYDTWY